MISGYKSIEEEWLPNTKKLPELKKYWRIVLKKNTKLNYQSLKQFPLFKQKYLTESEVLNYLLSVNPQLRQSYDVYQNLLDAFDAKDFNTFYELINTLPHSLNTSFKKATTHLKKHRKAIINVLKYPYSNGKLEGKNNLIKVIKRITFDFRTLRHLRKRMLIQQNICEII